MDSSLLTYHVSPPQQSFNEITSYLKSMEASYHQYPHKFLDSHSLSRNVSKDTLVKQPYLDATDQSLYFSAPYMSTGSHNKQDTQRRNKINTVLTNIFNDMDAPPIEERWSVKKDSLPQSSYKTFSIRDNPTLNSNIKK